MEMFSASIANAQYEAFGLDGAEAYGLDYESARSCTPCWYGVSSGDGNNGVSHTWPDYYVRCTPDDAYRVCELALVDSFDGPINKSWAAEHVETDGEADYTISAVIYDPPGEDDEESWSDVNGAWLIFEVFPVDELGDQPRYGTALEAFTDEALALVE